MHYRAGARRTVDGCVNLDDALDGAAVDAAADFALHAGDDARRQGVVQPKGVPDRVHLLADQQVGRVAQPQWLQQLHHTPRRMSLSVVHRPWLH